MREPVRDLAQPVEPVQPAEPVEPVEHQEPAVPVHQEPAAYSVKQDIADMIDRRVEREVTRQETKIIKKRMPSIISRAADASIPDAKLNGLELAARDWRNGLIRQLGGRDRVTPAQLALISAAAGSWIVLSAVDAVMFDMLAHDGLIDPDAKALYPIVIERQQIAAGLAKLLTTLGLHTIKAEVEDLNVVLARRNRRA